MGRASVPRWPADLPVSAHVFVDSAADLTDVLDVSGEDGHHLARVLRLRPGEAVTVADGSGVWRPYRVATVAAGRDRAARGHGGLDREPARESRAWRWPSP